MSTPVATAQSLGVYDEKFYSRQADGSYQSAQQLLPSVLGIVCPRSIVDVGCGVGTWLKAASELGVPDVIGIDGDYVQRDKLVIAPERFMPADLTSPVSLSRTFDLAMSLEVAEHLDAKYAAQFVASLCRLAPVILFSAAIPGQQGTHHVNEQWPSYWAELFREHGFYFWDCLRMKLWNDERIDFWYRQNAFLVCDREWLEARSIPIPGSPASLVHPQIYNQWRNEKPTLRNIPGIIQRSIKRWLWKQQ